MELFSIPIFGMGKSQIWMCGCGVPTLADDGVCNTCRESKNRKEKIVPTAGMVSTPGGEGRYVAYNPATGMVTVEMEWSHLVEFDGEKCYPM